jgi:shikimate kinase
MKQRSERRSPKPLLRQANQRAMQGRLVRATLEIQGLRFALCLGMRKKIAQE